MGKTQIITTNDVKHVALLAKLPIPESKIPKFHKDLESILEFVKQVQQAPTKGVQETAQVAGLTNIWREDKVDEKRMLTQEQALSNAQKSHNGYFLVPRVLE